MQNIHFIDRKSGELKQEIVPGENWLKWLYYKPLGKLALACVVKRKFLSQWYGKRMDAPGSTAKIADFVSQLEIDMTASRRPLDDFNSFNDFFIRQLKPESRPIDADPHHIVSPADGKILAFHDLSHLDSFFVKGQSFSLKSFLRKQDLVDQYREGTLVIIRLAPVDYHRFHFPADGSISESTSIQGDYYSVSPYAVRQRMQIYWENKREFSILRTSHAHDILMCEVGATMVGSIFQSYTPGSQVKKGQEKGWFSFGGSTNILLFEKGTVHIDPDILENTGKGYETSIHVGERIAATRT